jgi:mycothiol synthase
VVSIAARQLTALDLPALANEVERARDAGEFRASGDADAHFFLKASELDPTLVGGAFDGDELVGFISPEFKVVVVRPDHRRQGIGRALVELAVHMERDRGRPEVILGRLPHDDDGRDFLLMAGFAPHSVLWDLELPGATTVEEPVWPVGHRARTFESPADIAPWVALFNAAFADHATPLQLDESFIAAGIDDPAIDDADTLLLADEGGELVGFCATAPERHEGVVGPRGEIWTVGVRPDRQGQGLGRQLLRWGVRRLRDLDVGRIHLSVNGRNERALRLYEDEGFVRIRTRERWSRPVGPGR